MCLPVKKKEFCQTQNASLVNILHHGTQSINNIICCNLSGIHLYIQEFLLKYFLNTCFYNFNASIHVCELLCEYRKYCGA
jgi:hypothetical protein